MPSRIKVQIHLDLTVDDLVKLLAVNGRLDEETTRRAFGLPPPVRAPEGQPVGRNR